MNIKILISLLIVIVLSFTFFALFIGFEGGYDNDNLNYFCFCVVIGIGILTFLTMATGAVYMELFG